MVNRQKKMKYPFEVLTELSEITSFHDRVKFLKENAGFALKTLIQVNFSDVIQFDLPYGNPPFEEDILPPENSMARIDKAIKILPRLIKFETPSSLIQRGTKERKFIHLLESVHNKDAEIIVASKDKELQKLYPDLSRELAHSAFPHIVSAQ